MPKLILWGIGGMIYVFTLYEAREFFYEYSYLRNIWVMLGIVLIMLLGVGMIWFIFYVYNSYNTLPSDKNTLKIQKNEEEIPSEENIPIKKKEKKIVSNESPQRGKNKGIQKRYQELLAEYKDTLTPEEYRKFQEDNKYDSLLYDALTINKDKDRSLLGTIEKEKGKLYTEALQKILR